MNLQNNLQTVNPCADCYPCTNKCGMDIEKQITEIVNHLVPNRDGLYSLSDVHDEITHNKRLKDNIQLSEEQKGKLNTRILRLTSLKTYIKS